MGNKTEPVVICPKMFFAQDSGQGITQSCIPRAEEQSGSFHSSPAVTLEKISPSLLHLGRFRLDDRWIWGPRSRLHTTPSSSSFLLLVLLQAQDVSQSASGSLGSFSDGKQCYFYVKCSSHHKFATLRHVQLGVSSPVTWAGSAGGGGACGHWAVHLRVCCCQWWPLRDGMLTCVEGMVELCSCYLLWVMVTAFIFCYYN